MECICSPGLGKHSMLLRIADGCAEVKNDDKRIGEVCANLGAVLSINKTEADGTYIFKAGPEALWEAFTSALDALEEQEVI